MGSLREELGNGCQCRRLLLERKENAARVRGVTSHCLSDTLSQPASLKMSPAPPWDGRRGSECGPAAGLLARRGGAPTWPGLAGLVMIMSLSDPDFTSCQQDLVRRVRACVSHACVPQALQRQRAAGREGRDTVWSMAARSAGSLAPSAGAPLACAPETPIESLPLVTLESLPLVTQSSVVCFPRDLHTLFLHHLAMAARQQAAHFLLRGAWMPAARNTTPACVRSMATATRPGKLSEAQRKQLLPTLLAKGWQLQEERDALHKRFNFQNFGDAFGWMTMVALHAETHAHHPEW